MANLQPIRSGHNYMQLHTRETRDDDRHDRYSDEHLQQRHRQDIDVRRSYQELRWTIDDM